MAKVATEHIFTGTTTPYTDYDQSLTNLGLLIQQRTGATAVDKFVGPMPVAIARPMEESASIACFMPTAISFTDDIDWVFLLDNATAATSRRVVLYEYTKSTSTFNWKGFIVLAYPASATNHTGRALRVARHLYTTGTAACSAGTAVTGSGTGWQTARYAAGARIGFGTTDPTAVVTWYYISSIGNDTSITLSGAGPNTGGQGPFVIEELRIHTVTTNATATNGGYWLAKGVNHDDFTPSGTTISAATTVDNLKAVYWLADAGTVTNTTGCGFGFTDPSSDTNHDVYVLNGGGAASVTIFKYNARAALASIVSGKTTSAFVLKTGAQVVTGTIGASNNSRLATLNHGPGSGVSSIYFASTTRIYRAKLTNIVDAVVTFIDDAMVEIPPGSASTFAASANMQSVESADVIDRLIITTSAANVPRHYVTRYQTVADRFDVVWGGQTGQLDQSLADSGCAPFPSTNAGNTTLATSVWSQNGCMYVCRNSAAITTNALYAVPLVCHWDFAAGLSAATQSRVITPVLTLTNPSKLYRVYVNQTQLLGSATLGSATEAWRIYFRTYGIKNDDGPWTLLDSTGNLTGIAPLVGNTIQFMIEFKVLGLTCLPSRIHSLTVVYEDDTTDSHYQPSVGLSDTTNKRFAWRFATAFGGSVPTLQVRLYDAVTGGLLLDDNTFTPTGTFERSTDTGGAWSAWNNTDKGNDTTYIRYTPASLGSGIKVRALLTQA